jgi:hypothetical protein
MPLTQATAFTPRVVGGLGDGHPAAEAPAHQREPAGVHVVHAGELVNAGADILGPFLGDQPAAFADARRPTPDSGRAGRRRRHSRRTARPAAARQPRARRCGGGPPQVGRCSSPRERAVQRGRLVEGQVAHVTPAQVKLDAAHPTRCRPRRSRRP